tara:strand:- start:28801 stop:29256 length:456 start_codon:yes stop_codon:yes gene_type:complete
MSEIEEKIMNKLNELLSSGLSVINVSVFGKNTTKNINITIESEKGITLDDCANTSRIAKNTITMNKMIDDDFNIEVTSPGINRPLFNLKDFIKYQGEKIFVELKKNINNKRRLKGVYKIKDNVIYICEKNNIIEIPYNYIKKANLIREIKI